MLEAEKCTPDKLAVQAGETDGQSLREIIQEGRNALNTTC